MDTTDDIKDELRSSGLDENIIEELMRNARQSEIRCNGIILYTHSGDQIVNYGLRTGIISELGDKLYNYMMNCLFRSIPISRDLQIFRYIRDYNGFSIRDLQVGQTITYKGFSSFTVSTSQFREYYNYKESGYILSMMLPAGDKFLFNATENLSYYTNEYEIIITPGLKIRIDNIADKVVFCTRLGYESNDNDSVMLDSSLDTKYISFLKQILDDDYTYIINNEKLLVYNENYDLEDDIFYYKNELISEMSDNNDKLTVGHYENDIIVQMFANYINNRLNVIRSNVAIGDIINILYIYKEILIQIESPDQSIVTKKETDIDTIVKYVMSKILISYADILNDVTVNIFYEPIFIDH